MSVKGISLEDICRSRRWLGHGRGVSELVSLDPRYRAGREHLEWNKANKTFPVTRYVRNEDELLAFVKSQYGNGERMVCIGINPRAKVLKNSKGYERATREEEIEVAQNILFDLDYEEPVFKSDAVKGFETFAKEVDAYSQDLGLLVPVRGYSGRGWHLLYAHAPIRIRDCQDLSARIAKFADDFRSDLHKELHIAGLRLDKTHDLRRMVRLYGTAKPTVGIVSRFYGNERVEDAALRDYLLSMTLAEDAVSKSCNGPVYGASLITVYDQLPTVIDRLLKRDDELRDLWQGNGKSLKNDASGSGYDYSFVQRLIFLGVRDVDLLGTAIALRPGSSYKEKNKPESYLRRTIAKALMGSG